ncbi:MOSC domain-containing protein [soil metagenome]
MMRLLSVNLGKAEMLLGAKDPYLSGIAKRSVEGSVRLGVEGLAGDVICDSRYHGGPDQAVYLYGAPDYAWWEGELGRSLAPGTFGENLTLTGWESAGVAVGDRFTIGDVILEVTSPRVPCATLSCHMGDSAFLKKYRQAERPGVYCRVLCEGEVRAGEEVGYEPLAGETLGIMELYRDAFAPAKDAATLRRHLAAPLAIRLRLPKEEALAKIEATAG